jgi:hypothetical protein
LNSKYESRYRPKLAEKIKLKEFRRKVRETTEKELIRDALRARNFSGISTLIQGLNLIDFALRVNKQYEKEQYSEK